MTWLKLALLLLQIARLILERNRDGALIEAGKNEAENERIKIEADRIARALAARRVAESGRLQDDDGYKRD